MLISSELSLNHTRYESDLAEQHLGNLSYSRPASSIPKRRTPRPKGSGSRRARQSPGHHQPEGNCRRTDASAGQWQDVAFDSGEAGDDADGVRRFHSRLRKSVLMPSG